MMEACGFNDVEKIPASKFFRRIDEQTIMTFEEIYFRNRKLKKNQQQFLLPSN
jgi:hypothetical protein